MTEIYLVAVDGSSASHRALRYTAERAKASGAKVVLAHVLEWSPYSFLTKEELEERHARRKQEVARAETIVLGPMQKILADQGLDAQSVVRYGHVTETLCEIAKEFNATQIVVGRMGQSGLTARLFGSVAGTLAQAAPVPCTIVP
ncbi:MAG: universal stress protein family protein [Roseibaca calidilacus]|uniref:Nucleotide-binding universal stress protein, UspA family n=1 Tax=Roseibaca calidilacus TaxID=1666912 RepID=A0A0N8K8Y9_9RHOB|nr:universal stress protein [Roseibaca calidilacus]KPP95865.1 MAG: universal stress protein family protein [Roseibaca calidilacus]CUX81581.1 Nucleotide-binding universal stress protein, UspA family [Roseibaca calidilacus]